MRRPAQAGEARVREVIGAGGFQSVRRATETPSTWFCRRYRKTMAVIARARTTSAKARVKESTMG